MCGGASEGLQGRHRGAQVAQAPLWSSEGHARAGGRLEWREAAGHQDSMFERAGAALTTVS